MSEWLTAGRFILKWAVIGLAIACVIFLARPEWLGNKALPAPARIEKDVQIPADLSFADAVARAAPAVVNIYARRIVIEQVPGTQFNGLLGSPSPTLRQRVQNSLGSGVIVDAAGYVVTNNHVICGAQQRWLQLADGREEAATVVGTDPDTDIAVLKVDLQNPPVMSLGRSDALRVGDIVLAIGNPYGLSQTVTQGIVSATGRGLLGLSTFENFIQTDAAINLGNSGGALINTQGELVGINTAVLSQELGTEGISFAIPVNLVRGVFEQIIKFGRVKRGWFGVDTEDLSPNKAQALGLEAGILVTQVTPASPAAAAGIKPGDVITRINGEARNSPQALNLVASTPPGQEIQLSILRDGVRHDLKATLLERTVAKDSSKECAGN